MYKSEILIILVILPYEMVPMLDYSIKLYSLLQELNIFSQIIEGCIYEFLFTQVGKDARQIY